MVWYDVVADPVKTIALEVFSRNTPGDTISHVDVCLILHRCMLISLQEENQTQIKLCRIR